MFAGDVKIARAIKSTHDVANPNKYAVLRIGNFILEIQKKACFSGPVFASALCQTSERVEDKLSSLKL